MLTPSVSGVFANRDTDAVADIDAVVAARAAVWHSRRYAADRSTSEKSAIGAHRRLPDDDVRRTVSERMAATAQAPFMPVAK